MALDEPRDNDATYEIDGFTYLVDKDFMAKAQPIKIDYMVSGFKLDCGIDFGASSGGCSSCGSGTCG
ncbi:hypothetical protein [Desulfatirhabdium butyrativorans]|uniref:hypothetical protein n=1 Tax=Desulfatirhabdium butyrativorans TaxID=340467 RepID=UPI000409C8C0|nr:hypothetical protein [Desulfatirhabdium butyrativorans]